MEEVQIFDVKVNTNGLDRVEHELENVNHSLDASDFPHH
jgi:hypothetical protein